VESTSRSALGLRAVEREYVCNHLTVTMFQQIMSFLNNFDEILKFAGITDIFSFTFMR